MFRRTSPVGIAVEDLEPGDTVRLEGLLFVVGERCRPGQILRVDPATGKVAPLNPTMM